MKILIVNYEYPPLGGGGGVATKHLAVELARRHHVHVITTWYPGLAKQETHGTLTVHRVRVWGRSRHATASILSMLTFVPAAAWRGMFVGRRTKFDIINAQFVVPSGVPAVWLAWLFRVPFVLSLIGGDVYDPTKGVSPHRHALLRLIIRFIAHRADARTAISEDTKHRAQDLHGITKPITVIPLGFTPVVVPRGSRTTFGFDDRPLFISIGRLIPRKGYHTLLAAWTELPGIQLAIVGSGPLHSTLKQHIAEQKLTDRVRLTGFLPEEAKAQLLALADGYISASEHEGFGIVFLEAMAAGLPIVATNIGGQADFLQPNQNALLVRPNDAAALAAAVRTLVQDAAVGQRMRQQNLRTVQQFTWPQVARQFETVLERCCVKGTA